MRVIPNIIFALLAVSCSVQSFHKSTSTLVLDYEDFGPQVIAHEILGMEWWQWASHGNSRPTKYDIQVVVYRNMNLDDVSKLYPVSKELKHDYRYLKYADAVHYLKNRIYENIEPSVTGRLKKTLNTIETSFK